MLADRLSVSFLGNRHGWCAEVAAERGGRRAQQPSQPRVAQSFLVNSSADEESSLPPAPTVDAHFGSIVQSAQTLAAGIRPAALTVSLSRSLLALVLSKRLPMEVTWLVYSFCVPVQHVQLALGPLLAGDPLLENAKETLMGLNKTIKGSGSKAVLSIIRCCDALNLCRDAIVASGQLNTALSLPEEWAGGRPAQWSRSSVPAAAIDAAAIDAAIAAAIAEDFPNL